MSKTVVGIFGNYDDAYNAAQRVKDENLKTEDISILTRDGNGDGVSNGALTGGTIGGISGLLLGLGAVTVPGLGMLAAFGPIAGLLSGAIAGGIIGTLVDLGIPEDYGKEYEEHIKEGKVLWSMACDSEDRADRVADILSDQGAEIVDIH